MLDNALNGFSVEKARNLLKKKTENMLMAARCMSKVVSLLMLRARVLVIVSALQCQMRMILTIAKVADEFILHVWVPSHKVAKECMQIGKELTSQLPNCTVSQFSNTLLLCHVIILLTTMQMWITVCDEPEIYSNKSSQALKAALHAIM